MNSFTQKKSLNISQILGLGFGIVIVLIVINNFFSQWTRSRVANSIEDVILAHEIKFELEQLEKILIQAETGQRGFLYTGKEEFLEPYQEATRTIDQNLLKLKSQIKDDNQKLRVVGLESIIKERKDYLEDTIALGKSGQERLVKERVSQGEGEQLMDKLRVAIVKMEEAEDEILLERQNIVSQAQSLASYLTWGSTVLIITLSLVISFTSSRIIKHSLGVAVKIAEQVSAGDLTSPIQITAVDEIGKLQAALKTMTQSLNGLISQMQQSGVQVTSSANRLTASSEQLESTMNEQVSTTHEITATSQEIAATAQELARTVEDVADLVGNTATTASQGQQDLQRMEDTIRQLAEATTAIASKLGIISERANNINTVVTTITKVADQTNLLSLNAAIEAEKAGEYGAGFAVVAREIRRLADQTAVATLEIESMVKEMQSAVSTGVMEMDKFTQEVNQGVGDIQDVSQKIVQIIEQVQSLTPQFEVVNQGMETQSQGAQKIRTAMQQLNETSQQTSTSMQDNSKAINQLNEVVQGLQQEISRFKVKSSEMRGSQLESATR